MIPQDPDTAALGCGRQLMRTDLVRHFPTAQSLQHRSPCSSPSHSSFHSPLYTPCTVQYIALTEVTLTESWPWHLVKFGHEKRKMLGCDESPASKALGPAASVPSELPAQGREVTREGSMEETLIFCQSSSSKVSQWTHCTQSMDMAPAGSSDSRTQRN